MTTPVSDDTGRPTWTGLSTDNKPSTAPEGSKWLSVDTGEIWWFNDGMWVCDISSINMAKIIY